MSSKSFRVAASTEKVEFDLEYTDKMGREVSQHFHCRPTVPINLILSFASSLDGGDDNGTKAMTMIQDLFQTAIVPDEYPIFEAMLNDPDVGIDVTVYTEIASWLAEQYTARPTGANSPTTSPAGSSGIDSTDGVSRAPLTYSRPEPQPVAVTAL